MTIAFLPRATALLIAAALALLSAAGAAQDLRGTALSLVNRDREAHGLAPLHADDALHRAAQRHADDMLARGYFAHEAPDGRTVLDRFRAAGGGGSLAVGENLASCEACPRPDGATLRRFEQGWMESPGHRANILNPGFTRFGFGLAEGRGRIYAVQTFAGPGAAPARASGAPPQPLRLEEQRAYALDLMNGERRRAGLSPLTPSTTLTTAAFRLIDRKPGLRLAGVADLRGDNLYAAIPTPERRRWRALSLVAAECGGCGVRPTDADVEHFVGLWLGPDGKREAFLDPQADELGFLIVSDGEGRKVAVALVGLRR